MKSFACMATVAAVMAAWAAAGCGGKGQAAGQAEGAQEPVGGDDGGGAGAAQAGGGWQSQEQLAEEYFAALDAVDEVAIAAFFPPEDLIRSSLECEGEPALLQGIMGMKAATVGMIGLLEGKGVAFLGPSESAGSKPPHHVAAGEAVENCVAKVPMTIDSPVFVVQYTVDGVANTPMDSEIVLIRFGEGGGWYLMGD